MMTCLPALGSERLWFWFCFPSPLILVYQFLSNTQLMMMTMIPIHWFCPLHVSVADFFLTGAAAVLSLEYYRERVSVRIMVSFFFFFPLLPLSDHPIFDMVLAVWCRDLFLVLSHTWYVRSMRGWTGTTPDSVDKMD